MSSSVCLPLPTTLLCSYLWRLSVCMRRHNESQFWLVGELKLHILQNTQTDDSVQNGWNWKFYPLLILYQNEIENGIL